MDLLNATEVRKNWSVTLDQVAHERPAYVKRTHDNVAIVSLSSGILGESFVKHELDLGIKRLN